jgi:hypothetical protein
MRQDFAQVEGEVRVPGAHLADLIRQQPVRPRTAWGEPVVHEGWVFVRLRRGPMLGAWRADLVRTARRLLGPDAEVVSHERAVIAMRAVHDGGVVPPEPEATGTAEGWIGASADLADLIRSQPGGLEWAAPLVEGGRLIVLVRGPGRSLASLARAAQVALGRPVNIRRVDEQRAPVPPMTDAQRATWEAMGRPAVARLDGYEVGVPPALLVRVGGAVWGVDHGGLLTSPSGGPRPL